ncbi:MAG: hypothetical protein JNJ54_36000 [Myxococcaceae bacterium]|nr:hypothetical protein [Myxococcaceae bacterium]
MPKAPRPPTSTQRTADALIAAPAVTDVKRLAAAVKVIKRIYYSALGATRRRALRARLDEHYAALVALTRSPDKRVAAAAVRTLPLVLRPRPSRPSRGARRPRA